jgi:site-specific recombinase XerD
LQLPLHYLIPVLFSLTLGGIEMIVNLTQDFVDNQLICPDGKKSFEFVSSDRSGLFIKVTVASSGIGTFYLRYKSNSKTAYIKIGRTNEITLADARKKALGHKADIAAGNDPKEQAKANKSVLTFSEFFHEHYYPYIKSRKRSANKDESMFRVRLNDTFGQKRLNQISRREVMIFHTRLREIDDLAPASCDHHLKLMRRMFNLAVEWEILEKNPLSRIALFKEDNMVENYLDEEQLKRLVHVLQTDKNRMTCNALLFLLSTGARLNEALSAKWSQVDIENRVWVISAKNSKSKRIRSVPLNQATIDVLATLGTEKHEFLFMSHRSDTHLKEIHTGWKTLREKAGLPHLRIHDLRHSFASFLVNGGRTLYEVQQILGHSVPSVTQRYSHLSAKTLLSATDEAANCINAAMAANS